MARSGTTYLTMIKISYGTYLSYQYLNGIHSSMSFSYDSFYDVYAKFTKPMSDTSDFSFVYGGLQTFYDDSSEFDLVRNYVLFSVPQDGFGDFWGYTDGNWHYVTGSAWVTFETASAMGYSQTKSSIALDSTVND